MGYLIIWGYSCDFQELTELVIFEPWTINMWVKYVVFYQSDILRGVSVSCTKEVGKRLYINWNVLLNLLGFMTGSWVVTSHRSAIAFAEEKFNRIQYVGFVVKICMCQELPFWWLLPTWLKEYSIDIINRSVGSIFHRVYENIQAFHCLLTFSCFFEQGGNLHLLSDQLVLHEKVVVCQWYVGDGKCVSSITTHRLFQKILVFKINRPMMVLAWPLEVAEHRPPLIHKNHP